MIFRRLPHPDLLFSAGQALAFPDHMLFTETTTAPYACPEHIPGMGILTMLSGSGHYTVNRQRETLDTRSFLLLNQGSRLSVHLPYPGVQPLFLFFHTALTAEALATKNVDWCWLERIHPLTERLQQRLQWLAGLRDSCSSFAALKADGLIRGLLAELFGQATAAASAAQELPVLRQTTRVQLFKQLSLAREWIEANFASPVTLDDMAKIAAQNPQHFLRMFRDCYGTTPHRFLIDTRLQAARRLLLQTEESISAIGQLTGFESLPTFSRVFRQNFGCSPTAYRQNGHLTP